MLTFQVQQVSDRPIIDAIAPQDFLLIGDASDGNQVKRVLISSLTAYLISQLPDSPVDPEPPAFNTRVMGINVGGGQFTDNEGEIWLADQYFTQTSGETGVISGAIANTLDDALYLTDRYGDFVYTIPTSDNSPHEVSLLFAETYWQETGARVFRIRINGILVLNNFDIFAEGGFMAALVKTFVATPVNQQIAIQFQTIADNAVVSAILIKK